MPRPGFAPAGRLTGWVAVPLLLAAVPQLLGLGDGTGALLAATVLAAAVGLLLAPLPAPATAPLPLLTSGRVRPPAVPRGAERAFDPDAAGRPRPRAPGRTAPPSG